MARPEGIQWGLMHRKLYSWLIEHNIPRGRIDGQPRRVLLKLFSQKKSRVGDKAAEGSHLNKWSQSLAYFSSLQISD